MPLESATYINGLDANNPTGSDTKAAGDDHIRLIKSTLKATFPNATGAITATQTELNFMVGVTSLVQTQLNTLSTDKAPIASPTFTGTPTGPTPSLGDTSNKLATTAFVTNTLTAQPRFRLKMYYFGSI